eukprot:gene14918-33305_t
MGSINAPTRQAKKRLTIAAIAAHLLGVIVFILVLDIARTKYDDTFCCAWGSNGLHAVVMTFAFAWLGPWGSMAYKTYEILLGMSHDGAKKVHFGFQTAALMAAYVGLASKRYGLNAGGTAHYRTAHSWVGLVALILYTVQWLFFHVFAGFSSLVLTLAAICMGILATVSFGPYANPDDDGSGPTAIRWEWFNAVVIFTIFLGMSVSAVFYIAPKPITDGAAHPGAEPFLGGRNVDA